MQDNTDVCNTTANNGRVRDFAGNAEGDVHCHGFVWQDDSHLESFIIPLFNYVKKFDHVEERGYYGRWVLTTGATALRSHYISGRSGAMNRYTLGHFVDG